MPLHLEQLERLDPLRRRRARGRRAPRGSGASSRRPVEDDARRTRRAPPTDRRTARPPSPRRAAPACRAARRAPRAAARATPGSSPACAPVWQPQSPRQRSTPCAQLHDVFSTISDLVRRRVLRQELAVVGQPRELLGARACASAYASAMSPCAVVVAVGLAVGRDVDELRPRGASRRRPRRAARAKRSPPSTAGRRTRPRARSGRRRRRARSRAPDGSAHAVRRRRVDAARRRRPPTPPRRAARTRLAWCGARIVKRMPCLGEHLERRRRPRPSPAATSPRARGRSGARSRAMPQRDLRAPVARARERQDHVVVGLRERRAVARRSARGSRASAARIAAVDLGRASPRATTAASARS